MGETLLGRGMGISFNNRTGEVEIEGDSLSVAAVLRVTVKRETSNPPETPEEIDAWIANFTSGPMPGDEFIETDEEGNQFLRLENFEDVIEAVGETTETDKTVSNVNNDPLAQALVKFEATSLSNWLPSTERLCRSWSLPQSFCLALGPLRRLT